MGNPCKVVITRGKNKGKICGEINSRCKHVSKLLKCSECGMTFDRSTSYYRHINTHAQPKEKKIPLSVTKKLDIPEIYNKLETLEQQNRNLREEVEVLKQQPVTNYITIMGTESFYTELISKLGKQEAIEFLTHSNVIGKPLSVFQKLYLDGKNPNDYPVACRDHSHFRYLDDDKQMVDDRDGSNIERVLIPKITDAIILATNATATPAYDIRERLTHMDRTTMIEDLAMITNNPNHPFFRSS